MSVEPEVWTVLVMEDGHVSLLKDLSEGECRAVVQRLRGGDPWCQEAIYNRLLAEMGDPNQGRVALLGRSASGLSAQIPMSSGWEVDRCEWWGSRGSQLDVWPKPADYEARLAEAMKVASLVKSTNSVIARAA